jgi:hypothetical protein
MSINQLKPRARRLIVAVIVAALRAIWVTPAFAGGNPWAG